VDSKSPKVPQGRIARAQRVSATARITSMPDADRPESDRPDIIDTDSLAPVAAMALQEDMSAGGDVGPDWWVDDLPVDYDQAIATMEARVEAIRHGEAGDTIWLLDHPPLYTAGTSARPADLLTPDRFPVYRTGRGGQYTYHGPGQRIAYVMLDLRRRGRDVRCYVHALEDWVIAALGQFNLRGERRQGRVGIWIDRGHGGREDKIAAIGVRVRHWVSFHGISINVEPDLSHFEGIVPCGIQPGSLGVTSLVDLGLPVTTADLDVALMSTYADHLSPEAFAKRAAGGDACSTGDAE